MPGSNAEKPPRHTPPRRSAPVDRLITMRDEVQYPNGQTVVFSHQVYTGANREDEASVNRAHLQTDHFFRYIEE